MTQDFDAPSARASVRPPKLSVGWRWSVYGVCFAIWLTGAVWLILEYFYDIEVGTPLGLVRLWALRSHVLFGLYSVWLFGALWIIHVNAGWRQHRKRWSGSLMFGVFVWLAVSGYYIYHAAVTLIDAVEWAHWMVGLGAPAVFLLHRFLKAPPAQE